MARGGDRWNRSHTTRGRAHLGASSRGCCEGIRLSTCLLAVCEVDQRHVPEDEEGLEHGPEEDVHVELDLVGDLLGVAGEAGKDIAMPTTIEAEMAKLKLQDNLVKH